MSECVEFLLSDQQQGASSIPEKNLPLELWRIFHENAGAFLNDFDAVNFLTWFFLGSIMHFPDSGLTNNMQMSDIHMKLDHATRSIKFAFLKQNIDHRIQVILRSISFNSKDQAKFTNHELNELIYKWNVQYFQLFTFEFDTRHLEILTEYDNLSLRRFFSVQWRNDQDHGELLSRMEKLTREKVAREIMNEKIDAQVDTFFQLEHNSKEGWEFGEILAKFSIPNPLKVKNNAQLLISKMQNTYGKYRPLLTSLGSNDISYLAYVTGALIMNFRERFALDCTMIPMIHDLQSSMLSVISKYVYNPKLNSNVPLYVTSTNLDTVEKMKSLTTSGGKALLPSLATDSSLAVLSVVNFDLANNQHQISTVEINEGFLSKFLNMYNNPEIQNSIDEVLNAELIFDSEFLLNSADADLFETFFHAQLLALDMPDVKKFKFSHEIPHVTTYAVEHDRNMLYFHVHKNGDHEFKNIQHKVLAVGNILENEDFFNVHIFLEDQQANIFVEKTGKADILAQKHNLFTGRVQPLDNIDISSMLDMLQAKNMLGVKMFTENLFQNYAKQFCKNDAHIRAFLKGVFHPRAVFLSKFEPNSVVAIVPRQISSIFENSLIDFLRSPAQSDNILSTGRALFIKYKFMNNDENQLADLVENMSYDFYENYYSKLEFTEHELSPMFMQLISNNENLVHLSTSRISNSRLSSEECGMRRKKRSACFRWKSASKMKNLQKLASVGTLALMGKNIVAQVFQGQYLGALVTSGFLVTGPLLGLVSQKFAQVSSPLVRTAAPFVGKLSSAFVVYDLWRNIKNGDRANILADGTILTLDVAEIGVQLAESFGFVEGVGGILGPVGAALGAVVFIGVDIYNAGRTVEKMGGKIRLTTEEKFYAGLRAFLGAPPENGIEKLMQEKEHYQGMFDRAVKFLMENPNLGGYVFPAQNLTIGRWTDEENNYFRMNKKHHLEKLGRNKPLLPKNAEFLCFNTPKHEKPAEFGEHVLKFVLHFYDPIYILKNVFLGEDTDLLENQLFGASCRRAVGVSVNSNKTLLIDMKNGTDLVFGSKFTDNIFLIGNGAKNVTGGLYDDTFIFYGRETTGHYNGLGGQDTVDFTNYAPEKSKFKMSVWGKFARISHSRIYLLNFENLILRMNKPDILKIDCSIKHVDSMNGDRQDADVIYVPKSACYYNTSFTVGRKVVIKNYAQFGSFDYVIKQDSDSKIYLKDDASSRIIFLNEIHQIKSIDKLPKTGAVFVKFENHAKIVVYKKSDKLPTFYFGGNVELNIDNSFHKHAFVENNSESVDTEFYANLAMKIECTFTVHYPNRLTLQIPNPKSGNFSHVIHTDPENPTSILGYGQENIYVVDYTGFGILPNITIIEKSDSVKIRTLDLSSLSNSTVRKIDILKSDQNLILKIDNLGQITLEDQAYKNLHIVYKSFIFEITDDTRLQPLPIIGHADHLILLENDLPCGSLTFNLNMVTQNIDFLKSNQTLILLVENRIKIFNIILPNFYANEARFTRSLKFRFENQFIDLASFDEDKVKELGDQIEREKLERKKNVSFDHIPTVIRHM